MVKDTGEGFDARQVKKVSTRCQPLLLQEDFLDRGASTIITWQDGRT